MERKAVQKKTNKPQPMPRKLMIIIIIITLKYLPFSQEHKRTKSIIPFKVSSRARGKQKQRQNAQNFIIIPTKSNKLLSPLPRTPTSTPPENNKLRLGLALESGLGPSQSPKTRKKTNRLNKAKILNTSQFFLRLAPTNSPNPPVPAPKIKTKVRVSVATSSNQAQTHASKKEMKQQTYSFLSSPRAPFFCPSDSAAAADLFPIEGGLGCALGFRKCSKQGTSATLESSKQTKSNPQGGLEKK